jgi:hypothetical protein
MSFQAYLDNIQAKTGKSPEELKAMAAEKKLATTGQIMNWCKTELSLGHGHAMAIAHLVLDGRHPDADPGEKIEKLFSGKKAHWRNVYDELLQKVSAFGADVSAAPGKTYINLQRGGKKFAIVQPSAADRLDIGIKLKGVDATGRFEGAGSWNEMVTHRVRINDAREIDDELISWLKKAYHAS